MNKIQTSITAATIATALSLPLAGAAFADTTPVFDEAQPMMLAASDTMDAAEHTADEAGEAMSDTWITTKVKSALLAGDSTPGMEIEVETNNGVVSLSGTVATEAQREMAIDKAKTIEGVKDVSADGLKAVD
ncbi:BON domain-containing protein [Stutzerimonas zhaodongensis]|jgi:hyperosmotically inducible protein|uniref:Osmotically-inducible protein Y n=1 Tax=Stutzerimonas zhaodongensis TaxID=1176257 RepID=A0A365PSW8_9GAMM|nr:BON domain-containing protein [Stutzerimonas zhaodongensis]QWV16984.1 BON domain-containing protein [Stutzerimonas zhaodongensis]RBA55679.1 osmY [Stutzerimonas zhaodongensis]